MSVSKHNMISLGIVSELMILDFSLPFRSVGPRDSLLPSFLFLSVILKYLFRDEHVCESMSQTFDMNEVLTSPLAIERLSFCLPLSSCGAKGTDALSGCNGRKEGTQNK